MPIVLQVFCEVLVTESLPEWVRAVPVAADGVHSEPLIETAPEEPRLALHRSVGTGRAVLHYGCNGTLWAVMAFEDHGQVVGGAALGPWPDATDTTGLLARADTLWRTIHRRVGAVPSLMYSNRQYVDSRQQLLAATEEQRRFGALALYDFEQERVLLAAIRAGDRSGGRIILNEMLTPIFMEMSSTPVLQARVVELVTRLTRTALEDNPMLTVMWGRWQEWTAGILSATSVEEISRSVMATLDDFIDGVFLHGGRAGSMHVHRAVDYITQHYASSISLRDVAREIGISASRLAHLFREELGRSVLDLLHEVRVRRARSMLERTDLSCAEIAYEVGYSDQSYFTRIFGRRVGVSPLRYRTRYRTRT